MAEGLNRVMLLGNLGADPELRFGQGAGDVVLKIRMACTESWFDKSANERKERTEWVNVVLFGKRAEALQKILAKGSTIFVEGRLQTSSYEKNGEKRYSTDVVATNVILAGRRPSDSQQHQTDTRSAPRGGGASGDASQGRTPYPNLPVGGGSDRGGARASGFADEEDDIPF